MIYYYTYKNGLYLQLLTFCVVSVTSPRHSHETNIISNGKMSRDNRFKKGCYFQNVFAEKSN